MIASSNLLISLKRALQGILMTLLQRNKLLVRQSQRNKLLVRRRQSQRNKLLVRRQLNNKLLYLQYLSPRKGDLQIDKNLLEPELYRLVTENMIPV